MQKRLPYRFPVLPLLLLLGLGTVALLAGMFLASRPGPEELPPSADESETVAALSLPESQQQQELQRLAQGPASAERDRAAYILAVQALEQGQAAESLSLLSSLDPQSSHLGGYVLLKQAQAQALAANDSQARRLYEQILSDFPEDPVAAEALYELGRQEPEFWDRALAEFPRHPRAATIALQRLESQPNDLNLLRVLSTHLYLSNFTELLGRLVSQHRQVLTPEDWETIGFGYWEKTLYGPAGEAYAQAANTPRNLYRTARGRQLGGDASRARQSYRVLIQAFPEAEETGEGLLRLARLVESPREALPLLDQLMANFPERAPEALLLRSQVLTQLNSTQSAQQARQSILTQYSDSDTAAGIRWENAQRAAEAGNLRQAWEWAEQLVTENPQSDEAPQAAFWIGKWAQQLNRPEDAEAAFMALLQRYPESYYAWRAASLLGWNVGTFTTVRSLTPTVDHVAERPLLPAGSDLTGELYALGFDQAAWRRWQMEFPDPMNPTVAEQYTEALMLQVIGEYIDSLFMLSSLGWRDDPEELAEYEAFKAERAYWYSLYPLPFREPILRWSAARQLDPLLTVALIRQESRFMPGIRSVANAIGLMQVLPETADWIAAKRNEDPPRDLRDPDDNIRLGTLYLDYTHNEYNNNTLFALASYNAGPGNVDNWIARFGFSDPDVFVSQIPFPETRGYISSVMGNYWNYLRLYNPEIRSQLEQLQE
ncbi:MAG: tail length tape measure protein [Phormidium sp. GEM2.Bin31]|nr:MAG: tail length tape measure protein [Phormidium sp. GEM2.Bin31]